MFTIQVTSSPDREKLVAELWYCDATVAELSQDTGELILQVFKPDDSPWWEFDYEEFVAKVHEMKRELLERKPDQFGGVA